MKIINKMLKDSLPLIKIDLDEKINDILYRGVILNNKRFYSKEEIRKAIDKHLSDLLMLPVNRKCISDFYKELFGEEE